MVFILPLAAREYGSTWPAVRAHEGLHPVRRQEVPLILFLCLMCVPGPVACGPCLFRPVTWGLSRQEGPLILFQYLMGVPGL